MTIPTRDEFEDHIKGHGVLLGLYYANESILGDDTLVNAEKHKQAALATYDAQAARIQAADAEVAEFNRGFDAYGAGVPLENEPSDTAHDVWRVGWAWAAFPHLIKRVAELEASQ